MRALRIESALQESLLGVAKGVFAGIYAFGIGGSGVKWLWGLCSLWLRRSPALRRALAPMRRVRASGRAPRLAFVQESGSLPGPLRDGFIGAALSTARLGVEASASRSSAPRHLGRGEALDKFGTTLDLYRGLADDHLSRARHPLFILGRI